MRVWLWRWRRSPLKRLSDVVEAWVVLAAWVLALAGGLAAAVMAADAVERAADLRRAESRAVSAVVVEGTKDQVPARETTDNRVWATVRWTAPDGSRHTDDTRVPPMTPAGTTVTVWTDRNGEITAEPMTAAEARWNAIAGGVLAAMGAGAAALGAGVAARRVLERRRMAQWDVEWERFDTPWGRRTG